MVQRLVVERRKTKDRPVPRSVEEFLAWGDEDTWAEWRDGEIVVMAPASDRHQDIVRFLVTLLSLWLERMAQGIVRLAPFAMRLKNSVREPDLLVVTEEHRDRLTSTYLNGAADVIVEVVSPESVGPDRGERFYKYEEAVRGGGRGGVLVSGSPA